MIEPSQLLQYIIEPSLEALGSKYASHKACVLLLATASQESLCGRYVKQIRGPALGIYQIEPATHSMVRQWIRRSNFPMEVDLDSTRLVYDLRYSTQIARALYYSWPDVLPEPNAESCFNIYKKCYNSYKGKATLSQFKRNWNEFVQPYI